MVADGGGGPAWERDSGVLARYLVSPVPHWTLVAVAARLYPIILG